MASSPGRSTTSAWCRRTRRGSPRSRATRPSPPTRKPPPRLPPHRPSRRPRRRRRPRVRRRPPSPDVRPDCDTGPRRRYPPDSTLRYVATPSIAKPALLSPIADPNFGTKIERISNSGRHAYSRVQPWNSDGSLLLLGYSYPAPLYDGRTYAFLKNVYQPAYATWSNTSPNILYGTYGSTNQFVRMDVSTGATTVLRTFTNYSTISLGDGEGYLSDDDHYVVLQGRSGSRTGTDRLRRPSQRHRRRQGPGWLLAEQFDDLPVRHVCARQLGWWGGSWRVVGCGDL